MNRTTKYTIEEVRARKVIATALNSARQNILAMPNGWRKRLRLWFFSLVVRDIEREIAELEARR